MTYLEVTKYLESFINYEKTPVPSYKKSLKLERVKDFLGRIGNPQEFLRCIHIAGTKGKGSTCAFITYILREAGYRVGLYTSPHLSDFRERIRILDQKSEARSQKPEFEGMISEIEIIDLVKRLKPAIDKYNRISKYGPLSFFEVYTSLAFLYFKEQKTDFAVLETGLGGRLDATNVVNPLVCAITPISYEHTQQLGKALREIAAEKAGIIKRQTILPQQAGQLKRKAKNLIVISALQEKEVIEVIRGKCKQTGAKLYEIGRDILYKKTRKRFRVRGLLGEYPDLRVRLIGNHQLINATVALGVIEALRLENDIKIDINSIRDGLYSTLWPGRCEVVLRKPLIVLDGAQNIASVEALKRAVKENFRYKRLILLLGISKDKDIKGMCSRLYGSADEIITTRSQNPRAADANILASHFNRKKVHVTNNIKEAKELALREAQPQDLILVSGSLFVVGEFRNGKV